MNETLQPLRPEDVQAAQELAKDATSTTDVATLREMLTDQNEGSTTIKSEDGTELDVKEVGKQEFADLGQKAVEDATRSLSESSEPWQTEEK